VRTLGVDLGKARIGLALADEVLRTARPLETVKHVSADADVARIVAIAREWEVTRAVVGLPLNMDGTEGPGARHARGFAARLGAALGFEVALFDERLSTFEAGERLKERGVPGRAIRDHVDAEAAAVILQGWLDRAPAQGEDGA
jgi:putative holliday junction resolvase